MQDTDFCIHEKINTKPNSAQVSAKLEKRRFSLALLTGFAILLTFGDTLANYRYEINAQVAANVAINFLQPLF